MTQEQAERASSLIQSTFPDVYSDPVDPSGWFTLHIDRWTAEMLRDALVSLRRARGVACGLLEDVEDWLAHQAEPYPTDASPDEIYRPVNE